MKICCSWCNVIYKPHDPSKVKDPRWDKIYCCKGCKDADNLFNQLVERDHRRLVAKRKRLPR